MCAYSTFISDPSYSFEMKNKPKYYRSKLLRAEWNGYILFLYNTSDHGQCADESSISYTWSLVPAPPLKRVLEYIYIYIIGRSFAAPQH